jgi:hypothetical protein
MPTDTAQKLDHIDIERMSELKIILEKMHNPHADKKRLEQDLTKCVYGLSTNAKNGLKNITSNIFNAVDESHLREALIEHINMVLRN